MNDNWKQTFQKMGIHELINHKALINEIQRDLHLDFYEIRFQIIERERIMDERFDKMKEALEVELAHQEKENQENCKGS